MTTQFRTFKNKNFIKRSYDCTNIVFAQSAEMPEGDWVECDKTEIADNNCIQLYILGNTKFFGYL